MGVPLRLNSNKHFTKEDCPRKKHTSYLIIKRKLQYNVVSEGSLVSKSRSRNSNSVIKHLFILPPKLVSPHRILFNTFKSKKFEKIELCI